MEIAVYAVQKPASAAGSILRGNPETGCCMRRSQAQDCMPGGRYKHIGAILLTEGLSFLELMAEEGGLNVIFQILTAAPTVLTPSYQSSPSL